MSDTPRGGRGGKGAPRAGGGGHGRRGGPRRDDRRGGGRGQAAVERAVGPADDVTVVVDRREGVRVLKISRIERASHRVIGISYRVEFEGCEPIEFDRLGAARDRAKEPPPERPAPASEPEAGAAQPPADAAGPEEQEAAEDAAAHPS